MIVFAEILLLSVVSMAVLFLLVMASYNIYMVLMYRATRGPDPQAAVPFSEIDLPNVTVQLPVYNEGTLAEQCLRLAAALDYPRGKLQIQLLDDSDDGVTSDIARGAIEELRREYPDIAFQHLKRGDRSGYKAGALLHGTARATGAYLAIFDADFLIPRDFLRSTIHFFTDASVGAVQARWDYVNDNASVFTRLQADKLDSHQMFEQTARARTGRPVIFHGTAGIWRASALADAGGWDCFSEVEDVELTIRATLEGWRVVYLDHLRLQCELPVTVNAFLRQQMRWKRGWARVTAHYSWRIIRGNIGWRNKIDLLFRLHLTWAPAAALIMTLAALPYFSLAAKFGLSLVVTLLYASALVLSLTTRYLEQKTLREDPRTRAPLKLPAFLKLIPLNYLLFGVGTMWPLTQGTLEGLASERQVWEVTPKSGTTRNSPGHFALPKGTRLPVYVIGTLALGFLGLLLFLYSTVTGLYLASLFYLLLALGSGGVGCLLLDFFGFGLRPADRPQRGGRRALL